MTNVRGHTFTKKLMEKILHAMDSQNVNKNAIDFACYLSKLTNSMLSGVLLENIVIEEDIIINQSEEEPFHVGFF